MARSRCAPRVVEVGRRTPEFAPTSLVYSRERCPGLVARAVLQMRQEKKNCGEREEEDYYRH